MTYYLRAYATNSEGTSYGSEESFTTSSTTPTVTTTSASSVTTTTASSGGNVTDDGGASVTARGVCWSTSSDPTTVDDYTTDGTGTGEFTSSLTELTSETTYYVRAYATNSAGTSYGDNVSFTTEAEASSDWYFAEGAVSGREAVGASNPDNFTQWLLIFNPDNEDVAVTPTFYYSDGTTIIGDVINISAECRATVDVADLVSATNAVGTKLAAAGGTIYSEQSAYWDVGDNEMAGGYSSIGSNEIASVWYFAEGCASSSSREWISILNPGDVDTVVTISIMTAAGLYGTETVSVPATSRTTVDINEYIIDNNVALKLESSNEEGMICVRTIYRDAGGYENIAGYSTIGATAGSATWYFAEGRADDVFTEFITVLNISSVDTANVETTFTKADGTTAVVSETIDPLSRATIKVNDTVTGEAITAKVISTNAVPVVAERTEYWNSGVIDWVGAHGTMGSSVVGTVWYFAEGTTKAANNFEEWLVLYNPDSSNDASVTITFYTGVADPVIYDLTVAAGMRQTVSVNSHVSGYDDVSLKLEVTNGIGVVAERVMYWDSVSATSGDTLIWAGGSATKGIKEQ